MALLTLAFLAMTHPAAAADKIKIEIVEATTSIGLVPYTSVGSPEKVYTHCDTLVDVNCVSTVIPATEPSSSSSPQVLSYQAKAVMPDGAHVTLTCVPFRGNKQCKGVESVASQTDQAVRCFMNAVAEFAASRRCHTEVMYNNTSWHLSSKTRRNGCRDLRP